MVFHMKICFFTNIYPPASLTGPGEVVYNLQKYFLECGIEAFVFTSGFSDKKYPKTIRINIGKRFFFPLSPLYYLKKLEKMQFDIFNFHNESGIGIAPFLVFQRKPKIITTLHTEYLAESKATRTLSYDGLTTVKPTLEESIIKYVFSPIKFAGTYLETRMSDRIIAVSERTRELYANHKFVPKEKISVIHNGVDSELFTPDVSGEVIRKKYSIGARSLVILIVASGIILKGVAIAFLALKELLKARTDIIMMIVGVNQKHKMQLATLARALKIQKNVIMVEPVPNYEMPSYYSSSDVFLIPSLYENLPVVALEAMSSGKAVVASDVGGIPEIIQNHQNGILFEAGNVGQMVDSLLSLLENSALRNCMGAKGRRIVEAKYDWKRIGQEYLKEFDKSLQN
jgi:glycosyltransferase involved in cell wall biosynthesis